MLMRLCCVVIREVQKKKANWPKHYEPIAQKAVMNRGWTAKCIAKQSTKEWDCINDLSPIFYNCCTFKIIIGRPEGLWWFSTFNKKVRIELYKMMYVALYMRKWRCCILLNMQHKNMLRKRFASFLTNENEIYCSCAFITTERINAGFEQF